MDSGRDWRYPWRQQQEDQPGGKFCDNRIRRVSGCCQLRLCFAINQSDCGDLRGCETRAGIMSDLLNLAMLICASLASMAFGIFAAYYILRLGFALIRPHPQPAVKPKASPEM